MHETIEGEVILINLDTGTYYSLRETGADIWQGIQQGAGETQIAEALTNGYEGSPDEIRSAVGVLLEELEQEGLIERAENGPSVAEIQIAPAPDDNHRPFRAPVLEKHTDMQDLILLDPVHEVDARGWPHAEQRDPSS